MADEVNQSNDAEKTNTTTGAAQTTADKDTAAKNDAEKATAEAEPGKVEETKPAPVTEEHRTEEVKTDVVSAIATMGVGDHYAQRFANPPANPQPAPGVDPDMPQDEKVKLVLSDSDNPDPANPKVTYVPPIMVGDYLRAGWRHPDA